MAVNLHQASRELRAQALRLRQLADTVIQSVVRRQLLDEAEKCDSLAASLEDSPGTGA